MGIRLTVETARLVCQQWHTARFWVSDSLTQPAVTVPRTAWTVRLQMQQRCAECGRRSAVIVGSADWQQTDFFIQRSRCCDHN